MSTPADEPTPDLDQYFDDAPDTPGAVLCRVCGALVGHHDDYRRVHWDWHEAANGA
jgi:hypothetical protein